MTSATTLARAIDALNDWTGRALSWLALAMVLVEFLIVLLRYVFGVGFIFMQESVVYMHALVFMLGAGYTLLHNGHVRVDIFYREASPRRKAWVDLAGSIAFLLPLTGLIAWVAWPYVASSWAVFEGSKETSGIPAVFLLKSVILVFAAGLFLQGISMAVHAARILAGYETPTQEGPRAF